MGVDLAGVLWDLDGTLVDTEPYWVAAEHALVGEFGGTWSEEHALNLVGSDLLASARYIRDHGDVDLPAEEIVARLVASVGEQVAQHTPWRPGAVDLLARLYEAGMPCALVTMSYTPLAAAVVAQLPPATFASVVTGDRVSTGKPHPEPYLRAAEELALEPARCLAVEDSDTGCRSAVAAGCSVLAVPNHVPVSEGPGRVFASSLVGLDLDDLVMAWSAGRRSLPTG